MASAVVSPEAGGPNPSSHLSKRSCSPELPCPPYPLRLVSLNLSFRVILAGVNNIHTPQHSRSTFTFSVSKILGTVKIPQRALAVLSAANGIEEEHGRGLAILITLLFLYYHRHLGRVTFIKC